MGTIRKWLGIVWCVMFGLIATLDSSAAAGKSAAKIKVKVTFVGAELVENNHVGNEWWYGGYVNDKEVEEGASVTLSLKPTDAIALRAEAQEQDKYPDDGQAKASVKVSSLGKPVTKSVKVTVVENRGRYSGETATWQFTFKLQKV